MLYFPTRKATKSMKLEVYHKWQKDWQSNAVAKHFQEFPVDTTLDTTTSRKVLQSFATPGANKHHVIVGVVCCLGGRNLATVPPK